MKLEQCCGECPYTYTSNNDDPQYLDSVVFCAVCKRVVITTSDRSFNMIMVAQRQSCETWNQKTKLNNALQIIKVFRGKNDS